MIKVYTPFFFYSFGNVGTEIFYEVISSSRYQAKQNRKLKFFWANGDWPHTVRFIADVICVDNESDVQVKNELCGRSKRLPGSSQDSPKNFTVTEVVQAEIELY